MKQLAAIVILGFVATGCNNETQEGVEPGYTKPTPPPQMLTALPEIPTQFIPDSLFQWHQWRWK